MDALKRIVVALDVSSYKDALLLVEQLGTDVMYKVGLELICAGYGADVVRYLKKAGIPVFYDAKFADIPTTMGKAARNIAHQGVDMFSVHASSGAESIRAAQESSGDSLVLAVTALSYFDEATAKRIFGTGNACSTIKLAREAHEGGADGIICSPRELASVNRNGEFSWKAIVGVGIRPEWAPPDEQVRSETPTEAIMSGATHLVIGRPITNPPTGMLPIDALNLLAEEVEKAL